MQDSRHDVCLSTHHSVSHTHPGLRVSLPPSSPQEQASRVQTQLHEEELKSSRLLQQIARLEERVTVMEQESQRKDEVQFDLSYDS